MASIYKLIYAEVSCVVSFKFKKICHQRQNNFDSNLCVNLRHFWSAGDWCMISTNFHVKLCTLFSFIKVVKPNGTHLFSCFQLHLFDFFFYTSYFYPYLSITYHFFFSIMVYIA